MRAAGNRLVGVAAVTSNDVWAVGYSTSLGVDRTLIERWNGTAWSIVPGPNQGTGLNRLTSVAVVNSSDVWASATIKNQAARSGS